MKKIIKVAVCATVALFLGVSSVWADGTYKLYPIGESYPLGYQQIPNGDGEISIQNDVTYDGDTYATWWVERLKMMIYIPTKAAYVTVEENNPIIGKKFKGGWFSHKTKEELGAQVCDETEEDHAGKERFFGGDLEWTITSLAGVYEFQIALGSCEDPVKLWGSNVQGCSPEYCTEQ